MDIRETGQFSSESEADHWWIRTRLNYLATTADQAVARFESVHVLEVGCGTAQNIRFLRQEWQKASKVRRVLGIDPAIENDKTGLAWMKPGDAIVRSFDSAESSGPFEMLIAMDVLEHVDDDVGALKTWVGRLAPGGVACITVPAFQWLWSYHDEALGHRRRYTKDGLLSLCTAAGLRPLQSGYLFSWLVPVAYAMRVMLPRRETPNQSDLVETNAIVNRILTQVGRLEVGLGANPYFGTSVVGLFEKPES